MCLICWPNLPEDQSKGAPSIALWAAMEGYGGDEDVFLYAGSGNDTIFGSGGTDQCMAATEMTSMLLGSVTAKPLSVAS